MYKNDGKSENQMKKKNESNSAEGTHDLCAINHWFAKKKKTQYQRREALQTKFATLELKFRVVLETLRKILQTAETNFHERSKSDAYSSVSRAGNTVLRPQLFILIRIRCSIYSGKHSVFLR